MSSNPAYNALLKLSEVSLNSASGLPSQRKVIARWSGIGFLLNGKRFVTPMGHVSEIMEVPDSTRLPGVQPWVVGLSNVRGRLLPIFDLNHFFFGKESSSSRRLQRVLVLEINGLYSGLIVDQSLGMQHFEADRYAAEVSEPIDERVGVFANGEYEMGPGEKWPVFDMNRLTMNTAFTNVAAFV